MSIQKLKLEELNRKHLDTFKTTPKIPVIVVLDDVRSMHNVGAVFRTSDAFLIEEVILCGITPTPPHREIQKTALGATESVKWRYASSASDIITKLKNEHWTIAGIEQTTQSKMLQIVDFKSYNKIAVIFGNEVDGINDSLLPLIDFCIEIPQEGTKHSLNISVCAGIILWKAFNQYFLKK